MTDEGSDVSHNEGLANEGFHQGENYNAARPRYPDEALDYFTMVLNLDRRSHVLDLGAGTGIFTRQLVTRVGRVTAVEPSASMRQTFELESPGVEILEGSDSAIPVADSQVSAVFVAQAFHWFDAARALSEIHRVLTPGGGLGLIWNERDTAVEWIVDLNRAMQWDRRQPYDADVDFGAIVATGPFRAVEKSVFRHRDLLTHAQLRRRVLTTSYITLMERDELKTLLSDVDTVLAPLADPVVVPYVANVYVASAQE